MSEPTSGNYYGSYNTVMGYQALRKGGASYSNVAIGRATQLQTTTGNGNTSVGANAAYDITTGSDNTCIGMYAGYSTGVKLTTGSNNLILGHDA